MSMKNAMQDKGDELCWVRRTFAVSSSDGIHEYEQGRIIRVAGKLLNDLESGGYVTPLAVVTGFPTQIHDDGKPVLRVLEGGRKDRPKRAGRRGGDPEEGPGNDQKRAVCAG
jgi:hypothetical protein